MSDGWPAEPPRLTSEEMSDLAYRIAVGEVFITNSEEGLKYSFGLLIATMSEALPTYVEATGAMYEDIAKAAPRSINGFPFFTSGRCLHKHDFDKLLSAIARKQKALDAARDA